MNLINNWMSALLAGVCIAIGCIVNLQVGGIVGPILFTFGLITVVHYKYKLYTGTAGFINNWNDFFNLGYILLWNVIGCLLTALLMYEAIPELYDKVVPIINQRESQSILSSLFRAIFCGFLMTTAVKFARENRWLPLLWAVPVFILAGFYPSIADSFYYLMYLISTGFTYISPINYLVVILGNFIGCNLWRIRFKE